MNWFYILASLMALALVYFTLYSQNQLGKKMLLGSFYILKKIPVQHFRVRTWKDILLLVMRVGFVAMLALLLSVPGKHEPLPRATVYINGEEHPDTKSDQTMHPVKLVSTETKIQDQFSEDTLFAQSLQKAMGPFSRPVFISLGIFPTQKQLAKGDWIVLPPLQEKWQLPLYLAPHAALGPLQETQQKIMDHKITLYFPIQIENNQKVQIALRSQQGKPIAITYKQNENTLLTWLSGPSTLWGELGVSGFFMLRSNNIIQSIVSKELTKNALPFKKARENQKPSQIEARLPLAIMLKIAIAFLIAEAFFFLFRNFRPKNKKVKNNALMAMLAVLLLSNPGKLVAHDFYFQILDLGPSQKYTQNKAPKAISAHQKSNLFQTIAAETMRRTSILFANPKIKNIRPRQLTINAKNKLIPFLWIIGCPAKSQLNAQLSKNLLTFIQQGGIIVVSDCQDKKQGLFYFFDTLARKANPKSKGLAQLSDKHAIYRSFYLIDYSKIYGSDISFSTKRTAIIYQDFSMIDYLQNNKEMSIRTQINIIMFLLTGNYKKDQVHARSILKRLKRRELFR